MAELRYPRFNTIYPKREDAIKKLDELVRSYGEPVAIRYYNSQKEVCVILAIFTGDSKGEYEISYDSNADLVPSVYTVTKEDTTQTDEECIDAALFGKAPIGYDIVIITDLSLDEPAIRSYIYSSTKGWKILSSGNAGMGSGEGTIGSLVLGDSVTSEVNEQGQSTLEVKTDGVTLVYNEELGGLTVNKISGGTF